MVKTASCLIFSVAVILTALFHPGDGVAHLRDIYADSLAGGFVCGSTTSPCTQCTHPSHCVHVAQFSICFPVGGWGGCSSPTHPECMWSSEYIDVCFGCSCGNMVNSTCDVRPGGCNPTCRGGGPICLGCGC